MKVGIIPAGGKSARWDGYPKEMIPVGSSWSLLDRMFLLQTRALTDEIMLVSSKEKYGLHSWYVQEHKKWPNVTVLTADSVAEAILTAIARAPDGDEFIFGMPDTYTDLPLFPEELEKPLMLGLFETDDPVRYGVLRDNAIVDKEGGEPGQAWGAFMFDDEVAAFWLEEKDQWDSHTRMLNAAMTQFKWGSWEIEMYWDVASFEDYLKLLGGLYAKK